MFTTTKTILFRDADPAGVLFFARYLALAHDAYEEFMTSRGMMFREQLEEKGLLWPVIHAESDHRIALRLGDKTAIQVSVAEVTRRTFTIAYEFRTPEGEVAARCRTVHAAVDRKTGRAIHLPEHLAAALKPL